MQQTPQRRGRPRKGAPVAPKLTPSSFRLTDEDTAAMDLLAGALSDEREMTATRTDAIRIAVRESLIARGLMERKNNSHNSNK